MGLRVSRGVTARRLYDYAASANWYNAILWYLAAGTPFLPDDPLAQAEVRYSIADIAVFAYAHVAEEAGIDTSGYPRFLAWLDRVRAQPGFLDDLAPYPPNAAVLAGKSIDG
jgi:glutathione S-transferase